MTTTLRRLFATLGAALLATSATFAQQVSPSQSAKPRSTPNSAPAGASAPTFADTLTGDWGGYRTQLHNLGVDVTSALKVEAAGDIYGGLAPHRFGQAGEFDLGATFDGGKLWNLPNGILQVTLTQRESTTGGHGPPGGLLQQDLEVYGRDDILRLTEFWWRQKFMDNHLTLKFGRMPQGDFNSFTCDFINLTFCGAPEGNMRGDIWYNWPIAQWAAWARYDIGDYDLMGGVYEVNPRDLDRQFSPGWFHGAAGAMGHVEAGWTPVFGPGQLVGHYQAGVWDSTAPVPDVLIGPSGRPFALAGGLPLQRDGSFGYYLQGVQQVTGKGSYDRDIGYKNNGGLGLFFNLSFADRRTSLLDNQETAGFTWAGFPLRPDDAFGFAVGRTHYNSRAAQEIALANPGAPIPRSEYPIELFYSAAITKFWDVRPDVQYIVHPSGYARAPDEVQVGIRTDVKF